MVDGGVSEIMGGSSEILVGVLRGFIATFASGGVRIGAPNMNYEKNYFRGDVADGVVVLINGSDNE